MSAIQLTNVHISNFKCDRKNKIYKVLDSPIRGRAHSTLNTWSWLAETLDHVGMSDAGSWWRRFVTKRTPAHATRGNIIHTENDIHVAVYKNTKRKTREKYSFKKSESWLRWKIYRELSYNHEELTTVTERITEENKHLQNTGIQSIYDPRNK